MNRQNKGEQKEDTNTNIDLQNRTDLQFYFVAIQKNEGY